MTCTTTLPTRRQRLRAFVQLKLENHRLRIAAAGLALLAVILATALLLMPAKPEAVPLGTGLAGVDPSLEAPLAAAPPVPEPAPAPEPEPATETESAAGEGEASYYGDELAGRPTASGERFDPGGMTAAHRSLPLGSRVRVTHARTGEAVVVRINDRGPFHGNRIIDLSFAAARELGMLGAGRARVRLALLT